ncbi:hypothetical protein [Collimonas pratensis]|uniref:hypothetical protein n=1 Tax=Collimonas pratensis TaxID=279113 RepID=UPI0012372AED|nr:hypothetical protein [Collimonas pratensis]
MNRVLTVNDFYDGPRRGVAEFNGVPHIYEAEFDHSSDEYGDTYFLSPIESNLLALVIEDWEIWTRWQVKFKKGEVSIDSHPALPEDRSRHEMLKHALDGRLETDPACRIYVRGRFWQSEPEGNWDGTAVEWTQLKAAK